MDRRVAVVGSGAAGLITAHTLLRDGFDVHIYTRHRSPGGVWSEERVYPGLVINNVHGEFRFSNLPMPPPRHAEETGGRLAGEDMRVYMDEFARRFLKGRIRYETEVVKMERDGEGRWALLTRGADGSGPEKAEAFDKVVLCTGGCNQPRIPAPLSVEAARAAGFRGLVIHSLEFASRMDDVLSRSETQSDREGAIVIVGGGKSAQDIAAFLASKGRRVQMVFERTDAFLASSTPLPAAIRKSRFLSVMYPYMELNTRLERFLHMTTLGAIIVHAFWALIAWSSFRALRVPAGSPLRRTHSLFWGIRTNDEGAGRPGGFFDHATRAESKIALVAPARAGGYAEAGDGRTLWLEDGRSVSADVVVLCTGYASSWTGLFDERTADEIGLARHAPDARADAEFGKEWEWPSLVRGRPEAHPESAVWASSIYRGIVPAKNMDRHDFAINGAVIATNNGYTFEVQAHWISSYFLRDRFLLARLPRSVEDALAQTARVAAWQRRRFPDMLLWANESYSSGIAFFAWQQYTDELLADMDLRTLRSGGSWLTWAFMPCDLREIAGLREEREAKREETRDAKARG